MEYSLIFLIILLLFLIYSEDIYLYFNDIYLFLKILLIYEFKINKNKKYKDINLVTDEMCKNIKVLLLTFDNRKNLPYLKLHNEQLKLYSKKFENITYEYVDICNKNVYWCKLYLVLERLKSNNYDYILWLDSDTIITDLDYNIKKMFVLYNSDILIGHDDGSKILCAGLFAIKNSSIGIKFIEECINKFEKSNCLTKNYKLKGLWAMNCYEQGTMNKLIYSKYYNNTTILPKEIFNNTYKCRKNSFILHNYGQSSVNLNNCFKKIVN